MSLAPGLRLGAYEIIGPVGSGGNGEVYQARDLRLGRIVALKLFNTDHEPTVRDHARLREEARATGVSPMRAYAPLRHLRSLRAHVSRDGVHRGETLAERLVGGGRR